MSGARVAVLDLLRAQPRPATLAALAHAAGLHENTVREHLDALVAAGLVTRFPAEPSGRGRPAWLYQATDLDVDAYAGLATVLARSIHDHSPDPAGEAVAAGRSWGRSLARRRGAPHDGPADGPAQPDPTGAGRRVVVLLGTLGFAPDAPGSDTGGPDTVRLTQCPLLEAAYELPDVVCGVHLGLVQGALEEYGATTSAAEDGTRLLPFAEPGACVLYLAGGRA